MADFNALQAIINAYIKRNGVQAITGQILNGVLTGMVNALGKGYTVAGAASPTTDPGTMTGPLAYIAYTAGTYTHFDNIVVEQGEVSMLIYNEAEWHKEVLFSLAAQATVDDNIGVPSVGVSFVDGILTFNFRNMKGEPGENGQDGDPAGFGTISASISGGVGTPGVSVQSSGPDTAKNIAFQFTNLKGETGVTSCVVTVDNTTGNPSCAVSLVGQELHLDFSGLKGAQGNTGSSVDYPFTIVNNLTTDDATQALSAAMGVQLESEVSQLEAKVTGNYTSGAYLNSAGAEVANDAWGYSDFVPYPGTGAVNYKWNDDYSGASGPCIIMYNANKEKIDYYGCQSASAQNDGRTLASVMAGTAFLRLSFQLGTSAHIKISDVTAWEPYAGLGVLEEDVAELVHKVDENFYINLAYGAGINGSVNMGTSDRFVMFPIKVKPGDVLEWSTSDNGGATMIVSLHYGDAPADYITLSSSPYVIDNAHTYKAIRFYRDAASISVVTYAYKIDTLYNVYKDIEKVDINDALLENSVVDLGIGESVLVGRVTPDANYLRSDFIPLVNIQRVAYHLGGMTTCIGVSFYTKKDFSTQIQSANVTADFPIGQAQTIEGVILKENFPANAKYVVFCSVITGQYYVNDGKIHATVSKYITGDTGDGGTNILFDKSYYPGVTITQNVEWVGVSTDDITADGLEVGSGGAIFHKEYGLSQRTLHLVCKFGADTNAKISSYSTTDTVLMIDCSAKTFNLNNLQSVPFSFFNSSHIYDLRLTRDYQKMTVTIVDLMTGDEATHTYTMNGTGGVGQGAIGTLVNTGMLHDMYRFDAVSGASFYIKQLQILIPRADYDIVLYGDSVTEGEAYYPTNIFETHWVQRFIAASSKKIIASGRGGGQITGVLTRIKNELPYIKPKYVMVTIGTNGGNTYSNLSQLVEYIESFGCVPILNHIPCNESGTQVSVNETIDQVRADYGLSGIDFDLVTSLAGDGVAVNPDMMFWENYSADNNVYHHPNTKGSAAMFAKIMQTYPSLL